MASFDLSQLNIPEARTNEFYQSLLERVERLPGVQGAGLAAEYSLWTFGRGMGDDNSVVLWFRRSISPRSWWSRRSSSASSSSRV